MEKQSQEPVAVTAQPLRGPSFSLATVASISLLSLMLGAVSGGVIFPAVRAASPDLNAQQRDDDAFARDSRLLVTLGPLTVWAPPGEALTPVSSNMSLEQYLQDVEVRAAQLGFVAKRTIRRSETTLTVQYAFEDQPAGEGFAAPKSKAAQSHPRALQFIFEAGSAPGSLLLKETRADGRLRAAGQVFVDLIALGGQMPELQEGQFLTRRGLAEIRTEASGSQALFIDGRQVWPGLPDSTSKLQQAGPSGVTLQLVSKLPENRLFADHLFLVESTDASVPCSSRAVVYDVVGLKPQVVEKPLVTAAMQIEATSSTAMLGPFCQEVAQVAAPATGSAPEQGPGQTSLQAAVVRADGSQVVMHARVELRDSRITWAPQVIPAPQPAVDAPQAPAATTTAPVDAGWRATAPNRIASPIIPGGVLVSLTCSGDGHPAVAVSGLPGPAGDGDGGQIRFSAGGSATAVTMRWLPEAQVYEVSGRTRPQETAAVLARLSAAGSLQVGTAGVLKTTTAPGQRRVRAITGACGPAAPATGAARTEVPAAAPG